MSLLSRHQATTATQWVIEIGASHVAIGAFRPATLGDKPELTSLTWREIAPGDAPENEADDAATEAALIDALSATVLSGPATIVLPGHHVITKQVRVPAGAEAQRDKLIAFEAGQNLPFALDELYWDSLELGVQGEECEVLVVAAKRPVVDRWLDAVIRTGNKVTGIRAAGVTLLDAVPAPDPADAILSVGARSTHLVFRDGPRLQMRTLALAGSTVTRALADQLSQDPAAAEQLKRGVFSGQVELPEDTPAGVAVKTAGEGFAARLQLELNRTLVTLVRASGLTAPARLWLGGGGSCLPGLPEVLGRKGNLEITPWTLESMVAVGPNAQVTLADIAEERLMDLVGAGTAVLRGDLGHDLAPATLHEGRAAERSRPRWIIAAALLVLACALPGVHYHRLANARVEAARELRRQAVPVEALREQNYQRLDQLEHLRGQVEVMGQLVEARQAWPALLADLQEALLNAGDVWLDGLSVLPVEVSADDPSSAVRMRLRLSGRLLDRENPMARVSPAAFARATQLLEQLQASSLVREIENESFDASDPGILRFDCTLVVNPTSPL